MNSTILPLTTIIALVLTISLVSSGAKVSVVGNDVGIMSLGAEEPISITQNGTIDLTVNPSRPAFRNSRVYSRTEFTSTITRYESYCQRYGYTGACSQRKKIIRYKGHPKGSSYCVTSKKPLSVIMYNDVPLVLVNTPQKPQYIDIPTCRPMGDFCCSDNSGVTGGCKMSNNTIKKVLFASPHGKLCELDLIVPYCECEKEHLGYCPVVSESSGCPTNNCHETVADISPCLYRYC